MDFENGSRLVDDLWFEVREFVPEDRRQQIARKFITAAKDNGVEDWGLDTLVEEDANFNYEDDEDEAIDEEDEDF